tara:strand:- start:377 stop:634 length:258 start_codon:yes stop_codon:yes gene_type:complete
MTVPASDLWSPVGMLGLQHRLEPDFSTTQSWSSPYFDAKAALVDDSLVKFAPLRAPKGDADARASAGNLWNAVFVVLLDRPRHNK